MQQPGKVTLYLARAKKSRAYGINLCNETVWIGHFVPFPGKERLKGIFAMQQPGKVTLYLAWAKQGLRDILCNETVWEGHSSISQAKKG